jgi:uncharacterized protein YigE (DUF2233 family)
MTTRKRVVIILSPFVLMAAGAALMPAGEATLSLRLPSGERRAFWRAASAPTVWTDGKAVLAKAVQWRPGQAGVEWSVLSISGQGEARALELVVARIDPARAALHLEWGFAHDRPAWSVDQAQDAAFAVNAGMFVERLPWGWVVMDGWERLAPGQGPLSSAVVGLPGGRTAWVDGDDLSRWRGRRDITFAFQSYPTLLTGDGEVPAALRAPGVINLEHRDARLALGLDREGRLLVALTRLDLGLPGADRIPFGLTVPEMAAVMGSLGARQAMLLDGGISAQLAVADSVGRAQQWKGIRRVPLGLVAR